MPKADLLFQSVKQLETAAVLHHVLGLPMAKRGNSYKVRCPFPGHEDRHPSLVVYPGNRGGWCFACGRGGDNIALVSQILDVKPAEAARLIADNFGLQTDRPLPLTERHRLRAQVKKAAREREAAQVFQQRLDNAIRALGLLVRTTERVLTTGGYEGYCDLAPLVEQLPYWNYLTECLLLGREELRKQILSTAEREILKWLQ